MYANNEIGTIEPVKEISEIVHKKGMYLHVDAVAAEGKVPVDVSRDDIDLLKHEEAHGLMVMTAGRSNTIDQVPVVAKAVSQTVKRLRELSPL